jgi:hypothetical protein
MSLLISGQAICLALNILDLKTFSPIDWAAHYFQILFLYASITYPSIVVLLVSYNRSLVQPTNLYATDGTPFDAGTHISFGAVSQKVEPESVTLNPHRTDRFELKTRSSTTNVQRAGSSRRHSDVEEKKLHHDDV